jgi:hypothetical protein
MKAPTTQPPGVKGLLTEILLRGMVWSMAGSVFGLLLVPLAEALRDSLPAPLNVFAATVGAAALTALFYGSMRLTVLIANFTFIATLLYTWLGPAQLALEPLVFVGAGVGLAVGTAYGWKDRRSRVFCADAKIVAGAFAGVFAGALGVLLAALIDTVALHWQVWLAAPVAVLVYVSSARWFVRRCHSMLPAVGDGALVGLGVGTVTGLVFLIMAGTLDERLLGDQWLHAFVQRVADGWAATVLGCAAVCFPVGAVRAVLKVPWYNM